MTEQGSGLELTALVVTYNHARFIEEALRSVLAQKTDFGYEVVVSEDCSTDGTREVVERLAEAHPDRVRLLLSDRNLNDNSVIRRGLEAARGRYVALLDGDDAWSSSRKLQTQVDFLNEHPDYSACFHNCTVSYDDGDIAAHPFYEERPLERLSRVKPKARSEVADLVRGNFVSSSTLVFRSDAARGLPDWFDGLAFSDWALNVLIAQRGAIGYLDANMAVYRVHAGGLWTMGISRFRRLQDVEAVVQSYEVLNAHLGFAFDHEMRAELVRLYRDVAGMAYGDRHHRLAATCAWRGLKLQPAAQRVRDRPMLGVLAKSGVRQALGFATRQSRRSTSPR